MAWSAIPAGSASALGRRRVRSADGAISTKTMAAAGAAHANDVLDDDPSMTQIEKDAGTVPRAQFVAAAPDRAPTLSPVVIRLVLSLKPCAAWTASPGPCSMIQPPPPWRERHQTPARDAAAPSFPAMPMQQKGQQQVRGVQCIISIVGGLVGSARSARRHPPLPRVANLVARAHCG